MKPTNPAFETAIVGIHILDVVDAGNDPDACGQIDRPMRDAHLFGRCRQHSTPIGGEEFVAVLPECDAITAQQIMNDIRESFSALRFHHQGVDFGCTLSAGLVCNTQYPAASSGELLVAADGAMYMAKQGGRNRVCVA